MIECSGERPNSGWGVVGVDQGVTSVGKRRGAGIEGSSCVDIFAGEL